MKKLLLLLFVLAVSLPTFAGLKEKDIVGSWKYSVETDEGTLTGTLNFELNEGKLAGKVITSEGETFPFTKIEIRDNNVLYFELQPEYDILKATLTVDGKKYKGTVGDGSGENPVTGEKIE